MLQVHDLLGTRCDPYVNRLFTGMPATKKTRQSFDEISQKWHCHARALSSCEIKVSLKILPVFQLAEAELIRLALQGLILTTVAIPISHTLSSHLASQNLMSMMS